MDDVTRDDKTQHIFALPKGAKLFEYEIQSVLGHGGFGITYLAIDTLLQETVAVKEYLPNDIAVRSSDSTVKTKSESDSGTFQSGLAATLEEARLLARFRHPNIVHVRRFFEMNGTGYIVLDLIQGWTLRDRLSDGPIPEPEIRKILGGILQGLDEAHKRAVLHRDIKPGNVILRDDGTPVLIDFGAARDFQSRHSRSITTIASANYSPPEQYGIGGQLGPWTDFYALGAIAYRAVTGNAPPDSLRRLRSDPLVPAKEAAKGKYDPQLLATIDWMLQVDEAQRPSSVAEIYRMLDTPFEAASGDQAKSPPDFTVSESDGETLHFAFNASIDADKVDVAFMATPPGNYLGDKGWQAEPHYFELVRGKDRNGAAGFTADIALFRAIDSGARVKASSRNGLIEETAVWPELSKPQVAKPPKSYGKIAAIVGAIVVVLAGIGGGGWLWQQRATAFEKQMWEALSAANYNAVALQGILTTCGSRCSPDLVKAVNSRLATINAEEAVYSAAATDLVKMQKYLKDCIACVYKVEAGVAVNQMEVRKKQDQAMAESVTYEAARGNEDKLRSYLSACSVCSYSEVARREMTTLKQKRELNELKQREQTEYNNARGNEYSLNHYIQNCSACEYKSQAQAAVEKIQHDAKFFTFEVCNRSGRKISMAVSGRKEEGGGWHVIGWYNFVDGECSSIGKFLKGYVYYMARGYSNASYGWRGNAIKLCVQTKRFDRINSSGYKCSGGEKLESFFSKMVDSPTYTWTLNP